MPRAAARWAADLREALLRRAVFTDEQQGATVRDAGPAAGGSELPRATDEASAAIVIPADEADADLGRQSMDSESDRAAAERPSTAHAAATLNASRETLVRVSENSLATPELVNAVHAGPTAQSSARTEIPATPVLVQTASGPVELDQFVVRNSRLVESGATQTWSVRLVPETLGELRIEITSQDSHVAVRLISPHGDVRDTLDGQLHHLREALMREGVDVTRVVVASQSSSGSQLLPGDAGSAGGRSTQQGSAQGPPGQSPQSERGWSSQDGSPRGGNPSPKRHHGALELWA
jgi:flagellar hook-length control protein FliK